MLTVELADLHAHVGVDLGWSSWILVDQKRIDEFADATEDRQWIHTDVAQAANGEFGTTIAHGYLTLSLASAFLLELLEVSDAGTAINYGLDRVRFPSPLFSGLQARGRGELLDVRELDSGAQTTTRITVESSAGGKPNLVADVLTRFLR